MAKGCSADGGKGETVGGSESDRRIFSTSQVSGLRVSLTGSRQTPCAVRQLRHTACAYYLRIAPGTQIVDTATGKP
ncbi:MAG: hypothetical protein HQ582_14565 [Planctomycetes bacterium]|nr:hypothetical protein [Planctomycetota bacterium]